MKRRWSVDVFEKCGRATEFESRLKESGHHFFFRKLESPQDSEVVVNGKRMIMIGSNNYLGLINSSTGEGNSTQSH